MEIITKYPVYVNKEKVAGEDFLNAPGSNVGKAATSAPTPKPASEPTEEEKKKKALQGLTWDKVKGGWAKAKEKAGKAGGFIDSILDIFGTKGETAPETIAPVAKEEKKGMSTGVKVALIGGGVILVGVLVYLAARKK